ncbi:MAG: hypothetical protein AB7G11_03650 [Phycisphaerales bacterium]
MVSRLGKFYSRRIVNVNVNILLAGIVAIPPTSLVIHLCYHRADIKNAWVINVITFFADLVFDVATYYGLHWLANHWPGRRKALAEGRTPAPHLTYFRDATLVQMERIVLSPILYGVVFASQHVLLHRTAPEYATAIGLFAGITCTRVLHTIWMVYQQRRWARAAKPT